jgi:DNA-binding GntR family transcriptional regulator
VKRGQLRQEQAIQFHVGLYKAVGNEGLILAMEPLLTQVRRVELLAHSAEPQGHTQNPSDQIVIIHPQAERWDEHAEIIERIAHGRVGRARSLARAHVEKVRDVVMAYLSHAQQADESVGSLFITTT